MYPVFEPSIIVPEKYLQAHCMRPACVHQQYQQLQSGELVSVCTRFARSGCHVCLLLHNQGLTTVMLAQGKLDAVAAALLLTAYYERPEAAVKVKSIKRSQ